MSLARILDSLRRSAGVEGFKSHPASPSPADLESLTKKAEMIGAERCYLVSRTTQPTTAKQRGSINLSTLLEMAPELCDHR